MDAGPILTTFAVGDHPSRWRFFERPDTVVEAWRLPDVEPALAEAARLARRGQWVMGLVSYEAAPAFDPDLTTRPPGAFPLAWFAAFDAPGSGRFDPTPRRSARPVGPWAGLDRDEHRQALARITGHIEAGDTYQVNHTVRLRAPFAGDARALFAQLVQAQPTPYSMYVDVGRWAVCSVSPELFVRRAEDRLTTEPMKGTAARGDGPTDAAERAALRASTKDLAENVMIVDLLRNDMARICRPGTVRVTTLGAVQTLPTLHTMTSTIEGHARDRVDLVEVFRALFPCGSVTGAPKSSTMRIIASLETSPRGVYCGAVGVIAPGGDFTFSVPIRTAVVDRRARTVEYGVGSGITYASLPEVEFEELGTKALVLDALA